MTVCWWKHGHSLQRYSRSTRMPSAPTRFQRAGAVVRLGEYRDPGSVSTAPAGPRHGHTMNPSEIRELDFSQFHPFDHWPGSVRCRSMYGGPRNHLRMAWDYKWCSEIRARTLCRIRRHQWTTAWQRSRGEFRACAHCWEEPR